MFDPSLNYGFAPNRQYQYTSLRFAPASALRLYPGLPERTGLHIIWGRFEPLSLWMWVLGRILFGSRYQVKSIRRGAHVHNIVRSDTYHVRYYSTVLHSLKGSG